MGLFGKKKTPPITDPQVVWLLHTALDEGNYGAVEDLYDVYSGAPSDGDLWDWWLDQAEAVLASGNDEIASLALKFARAANVEPWGSLSDSHYDRIRSLENRIVPTA